MTAIENQLYRKVSRRIIPLMIVLYLVSFLDRVNVGFAALTMNRDLGFTPSIYGWGAGIFFFGYFLFEVPSNIILEKVGARLWICRIMLTWGIVSSAMAMVQGVASFYALRFLLGVAEAGFLPGMILYLTYWFPSPQRAKYIALFMAAVPLASVVGAPVSGWILGIDGVLGLKGWQWLFVIEGIPACILGVLVLALLPDGPARAKFLTPEEREIIADLLARDRAANPYDRHHTLLPALVDRRVLLLSLI
jgi:ACS family tartrate transporter-like MFS transporter